MSQWKLAVQTRRVEDGKWQMIQPEAALCLMFVNTLLIDNLQSDPYWLLVK